MTLPKTQRSGRLTQRFRQLALLMAIAISATVSRAQTGCNCASFSLINPDFEQPGVVVGGLGFFVPPAIPGWQTTDIFNQIEIWGTGFNGVPAYHGINFAELNANSPSLLYQNVTTCPGQVYNWQVAHRGRSGTDQAILQVGPPGGPFTTIATMTDGTSGWGFYSGSYTVPAGQTTTQLRLSAVFSAGGGGAGNFIDDFLFTPTFCTVDNDFDGYTEVQGDCNDADITVYPGAPEVCDGKDNNCNGQVDEVYVASISAGSATTFCTGGSVTLTVSAGNSYQWKLNGNSIPGAFGQTYIATQSGNYSVAVTGAGSCAATSPATVVTVNPIPVVTASNDGPVPITGNINLSASGATTYSWTGPAGFNATGASATVGFAQLSNAGIYTVTGTANGCSATATTTVKVLQGPADVITGIRTWLDASDINADGNNGNNPANNSAINTWNDKSGNGNNGVQLGGTNAGVIKSDAGSVINGKPVVRFAGSNVYNFGNIDIRAGVTPDVSVITVYRLSGQGHEGLWGNDDGNWDRFALASFSFTGNNNNGIASRGPNQNPPYTVIPNAGIPGNLYLFTAIYDGQVSGGVNNGPANGSSFWFNGSLLGTFTDQTEPLNAKTSLRLGFDGDDGFMDGDIAEFIVYDRVLTECEIQDINVYLSNKYGVNYSTASITASGVTTFCQGDSVTLTASEGDAYQWKLNGSSINGAVGQTLVVKQAGSYTVDITGMCGKAKSAPVTVTVNALPVVTATSNSPVNAGGTVSASASGATTYTWSGPNSFIAAGSSFNINNAQLAAAGTYIVTGTDANGCKDTGNTTVVINNPGKALHFDGINDWVGIPVMPAINSIPVTLEAMIKPELRPEGNVFYPNNVLSNDLPGNHGLGFGVNVYNGGSRIVVEYKNGFYELFNAAGIAADQWAHVAVVYNLGNFKIYINGAEAANVNHAVAPLNNTVHMHIGKHNDDGGYGTRRFFKGAIDEVRVWNRALCSAEITAQYSCQLNGQGTGLFANYNFDQGFANANNSGVNTLADATANGSTGTLNAFALNGATSNWIAPGGATTNCTPYLVGDIHVKGNGQNIFNNTTTVSTAANTDMGNGVLGNTITKLFTLENNGTAPITVSGISITGAQAANFTVSGISFPVTIPANANTTYNVVFNGSSVSQHNATVNIASNDCDESSYQFAIRGTITCAVPAFTSCPQNIIANNTPGQCKAGIVYAPSVATTGTPAPSLSYSMTGATVASGSGNGSGTQFNVGVTNVTITATNPCGTATCSFTVTIKDVSAPVLSGVPTNTTVSCEAVPTPAVVSANDNCGGATAVNYFQFPNVAANQTHYWPADGNTNDVVGGANGTASGLAYAPGLFGGNSFLFNGSATIDAGTAGSITGTGDFSVSAWVKTTGTGGMTIIQQRDASVDGQYILKIGTNHNGAQSVPGKAYFLVSGDGGLGEMYSNASVNDGQWHHVAAERNGTALKLYIDGSLDNTTSTSNVVTMNKDGNVRTFIGYDYRNTLFSVPANNFVGQMDNVKVFYKSACPTAYQRNRVWTSTDAAGNMVAADQNISVIDATAPALLCPANMVISSTGTCGAVVAFNMPTATDNCDSQPEITISKASGSFFPVGTTTVHVQAKDGCGNTSNCSFTVTVNDVQLPVVTCPSNTTINCNASSAPTATGNATATDNCGVLEIAHSDVSTQHASANNPSHYNYTITRTWTATDIHNNTNSCVQTITVQDVTDPSITVPSDVTVNCQDNKNPAATNGEATGSDNCSPVKITYSDASTQNANPNNAGHYNYLITRTWTATDVTGNSTSADQTITVQDITNPGISVPSNATVNCQDDNTPAANGNATGTDNCSPVAITYSDASTQNANPNNSGHYNYVITRTWTATDVTGNSTSADQTITVQDITKPGINVPQNVTLNCQDDNSTIANGTATGTDNCSPVAITHSDASTQNANPNNAGHYNYVITRTWTATDVTGNSTSADQTITVQDITKPGISVPSNATVNCQDDNTPAANGTATGTDNCSPVAITFSDASTQNANPNNSGHYNYVITRTWTATDVTGNSTSADQTITVQDITKPGISVPSNVTVNCQDDKSTTANGTATGTDNCSPVAITYSDASTQIANPNNAGHYNYVITRTWTATDVTGNSTSADQTISVQDITAPSISCPANATVSCKTSVQHNGSATGSDNCSPVAITYTDASTQNSNPANSGYYNYTITRTWKATDVSGNFTTSNQVISVHALNNPAITVSPVNTINTKHQNHTIYLGYGPQSVTLASTVQDGVGNKNHNWTPITGCATPGSATTSVSPLTTTTYTVTITDATGCSIAKNETIQVIDVRCGNKIKICHYPPGNNGNPQQLCLPASAIPAHLAHGCVLGDCPQSKSSEYNNEEEENHGVENMVAAEVKVYPNPNTGAFTVELPAGMEQSEVVITDMAGKVIQKQTALEGTKLQFDLGPVARGMYMLHLTNGSQSFRTRISVQ